MLTETDLQMLRIAYEEAKLGFDEGGCPIGSVLARGGEEVSRGHNQRVQQGDPIAHGEMDALRKAGRQKSYRDTVLLYDPQSLHDVQRHLVQFGIPRVLWGKTPHLAEMKSFFASTVLKW
ncbi:MAG: hypothetical protein CM15mP115_01990 [Alphaproteobacteria bacterium]|nr:MAG: hypothetical protein CM15mP115_01990 [Alphaproteobacteria bacterium]